MAKQISDEEVDAFMRRLKFLIGLIIVIFLLPLAIYAVYLDQRLNKFEEILRPNSPELLQADDSNQPSTNQIDVTSGQGQVVYVPAYSHIYHSKGKPYLLTITLSVRNTSQSNEIVVRSIRYFDTKGKEVKSYLEKPVRLPALGTTEIVVNREDATGGSGANFLVEWAANHPVSEPIIEAVMIDTSGNQGISFVRRGTVISELQAPPETSGDGDQQD